MIASYIPRMTNVAQILCSGNFTAETVLRLNGFTGKINSNDVSLYTSAIGWFLTGADFRLDISEELKSEHKFTPLVEEKAATVILLLELSQFYPRKNDYQRRMYGAMLGQWPKLLRKTVSKLGEKKNALQISDYYCADALQVIETASQDVTFLSFLPTYKGGYEKLYKTMECLVDWDRPSYEIFDPKDFALPRKIIESGNSYLIYTEFPLHDGFPQIGKPVAIMRKSRSMGIYLYSNIKASSKIVQLRQKIAPANPYKVLASDEAIRPSATLDIQPIRGEVFDYLRTLYLKPSILWSKAQFTYAVTVDGKIVGLLGFNIPSIGFKKELGDFIYMMADLAVPSVHKRLSKLILLVASSREMKDILEKKLVKRVDTVYTTAFSNNPVSMKYRGVFTLANRKEVNSSEGRYALNYYAKLGEISLKDILLLWKSKYDQDKAA
ncbi:MAG: hypothetical protein HQK86_15115 [Nitrospinae bacterium]|nr:hypothetical protein [Nitrospinota bacterium]